MVEFARHDSRPGEEDPGWKWYIRSLYWMLTTASTIGFGDIVPVNLVEVILSLICTFCGTFLLAIVLCQWSAGVTSLQKSHLEYLYRLKGDVVSIWEEVLAIITFQSYVGTKLISNWFIFCTYRDICLVWD